MNVGYVFCNFPQFPMSGNEFVIVLKVLSEGGRSIGGHWAVGMYEGRLVLSQMSQGSSGRAGLSFHQLNFCCWRQHSASLCLEIGWIPSC